MWKYAAATLTLALTALPLRGHDYWLLPGQFFLPEGGKTDVRVYVGDGFKAESERPFDAAKTVRFRLVSDKRASDLSKGAKDGAKPFGAIAPGRAGGHLVAMERDWSLIELKAEKFNSYLDHEGLSAIQEMRRKAGEADKPGRERYRRYLKALVRVGDEDDDVHARRVGHRLEIVLETDPHAAKKGGRLAVRVVFDDKPLAGAQVIAYRKSGEEVTSQSARTDKEGRARFRLTGPGVWLIRLVHMRRCEDAKDVDWESFWAAYSFATK